MRASLGDSSFASKYDDLRRMDAARTAETLADATIGSLAPFGIEKTIAVLVTPERDPEAPRLSPALMNRWSGDWSSQYRKQGYLRVDPAIHRPAGPSGAARWRDVFGPSRDPLEQEIMGGASECGLKDGLTFVFPMGDRTTAVVSFAGDKIDCNDDDVSRIALVAHFATTKAICMQGADQAPPVLTPRERDVLLWTCEGKTEWEIGEILGISEHSADEYVRSLKTKLQACSKTQLVARAFRLGLI